MQLPVTDGAGERKFSLSSIRFGIDAEIDAALSRFGNAELHLSKVYWPKAFRTLISNILISVLNKPNVWKELCTAHFVANETQMRTLIEELKLPTSPDIKVKQRRWIVHLLRWVSMFRKQFGIGVQLPKLYFPSNDWPVDLEDKDDLSSSLAAMSLREDVRNFVWNMLEETIPAEKYCTMHYFGAIRLSSHNCPIVLEVPEDFVVKLKHRIETISEHLRYAQCENLLPVDVVYVRGIPNRELIAPVIEGSHPSD